MKTWTTKSGRPVKLSRSMEVALVTALARPTKVVAFVGRSGRALEERGLTVVLAGWRTLSEDGVDLAEQIKASLQPAPAALEGEPEPAPKAPEYRFDPAMTEHDRAPHPTAVQALQNRTWRERHGIETPFALIEPDWMADAIEADHAEALLQDQVRNWRADRGIGPGFEAAHYAIQADHARALAENEDRVGRAISENQQVAAWRKRHDLGFGRMTGESIAAAIEADHAEALEIEAKLQAEADRRIDGRRQRRAWGERHGMKFGQCTSEKFAAAIEVDHINALSEDQLRSWAAGYGVEIEEIGAMRRAVEMDHAVALAEDETRAKATKWARAVSGATVLADDRIEKAAQRAFRARYGAHLSWIDVEPETRRIWREVAGAVLSEDVPVVDGELVRVGRSPALYKVSTVHGDMINVRLAYNGRPAGSYPSWMVRRA